VKCSEKPAAPLRGGGLRGVITSFSTRSRRRLRERLHRMRWPASVLFLTLTFDPSRFTSNWKYHLHRFIIGFLKANPGWAVIWKLELHQSGMPHFHLLLVPPPGVRIPFIPHGDLSERWGMGFVWVERVWQRRIAQYLAKYVYKSGPWPSSRPGGRWERVLSLDPGDISETAAYIRLRLGRFWGIRGSIRWARVRLGAPAWAIRRALEIRQQLEKVLGFPIRGWLAVFLDRQVT